MTNHQQNYKDTKKLNEEMEISSDSAKMTSELALNALQNNNTLFANALLKELEVLAHDGEK